MVNRLHFKTKPQRQYNKQRAKARNRLASENRSGVKHNKGVIDFPTVKGAQAYAQRQRNKRIAVWRTGKKVYFKNTVYQWQYDLLNSGDPHRIRKARNEETETI